MQWVTAFLSFYAVLCRPNRLAIWWVCLNKKLHFFAVYFDRESDICWANERGKNGKTCALTQMFKCFRAKLHYFQSTTSWTRRNFSCILNLLEKISTVDVWSKLIPLLITKLILWENGAKTISLVTSIHNQTVVDKLFLTDLRDFSIDHRSLSAIRNQLRPIRNEKSRVNWFCLPRETKFPIQLTAQHVQYPVGGPEKNRIPFKFVFCNHKI